MSCIAVPGATTCRRATRVTRGIQPVWRVHRMDHRSRTTCSGSLGSRVALRGDTARHNVCDDAAEGPDLWRPLRRTSPRRAAAPR